MNYFELFELPVKPTVDETLLKKKYFELSRKYHPDFYQKLSAEEQEIALQQSSAVNTAFKIFKNKLSLIQYYLQLKNALAENEKYELSKDFLMKMMEINEMLSFADDEAEKATVVEQIKNINTALEQKLKAITEHLNSNENEDEKNLLALKDIYYQKKYLLRILDSIK